MKKKLLASIFALTLAFALSGCGGNNEVINNGLHTSSTSLGVEEVLTTSAAETTTLPLMPYATEETKPAVKTKSESREEIVAGILTAFLNKDEETYSEYLRACSSGTCSFDYEYNIWCRFLEDNGVDWKNNTVSLSDFNIVYYDRTFPGEKSPRGGTFWYCYYDKVFDEKEECLAIVIIFKDMNYSTETYSLERIYVTTDKIVPAGTEKEGQWADIERYYQGDLSAYITEQ